MAYKDEYEVARLYAEPAFAASIKAAFGEAARPVLHLAPPLFARKDPATGQLRKRAFGPWILVLMKLLARLKGLRGRWCDPFGFTHERRAERAVRDEFFEVLEEIVAQAGAADFDRLVELASLPQTVRGFGHVKAKALETYRTRLARLRANLTPAPAASDSPASRPPSAAPGVSERANGAAHHAATASQPANQIVDIEASRGRPSGTDRARPSR
jgi:indolepyruvate ferredoxin oxidoreductase